MLTPAEFRSALTDMVDASADGPREKTSFSYRGSLYVRLTQFQEWLQEHGHDASSSEAAQVLRSFGLRRYAFKYRSPADRSTSLSTFRSDHPALVSGLPEWLGPRMARVDVDESRAGQEEEHAEDDRPADASGRLPAPLRFAVELRAEDATVAVYERDGWSVERVGHVRPGWDLTARRAGDGERHIEVKGSTGEAISVEVTPNEVAQARAYPEAAVLATVSNIQLDGETASGGVVEILEPWMPADEDLRVTRYSYRRPRHGDD